MATDGGTALARRLYQAFTDGDLAGAAAMATDDIEVVLVPMGQTFRGRPEFQDGFMGGFKRAFPDLEVTVVNQVSGNDQIVNECSWRGRHTGPLAGPTGEIPPTGKTVENARFCEVWQIKNGRIARITNYQDAATWMRQLGLVP